MSPSSSFTPKLFQDLLGNVHHSRRLLLHTTPHNSPATASPPATEPYTGESSFNANVVMIFSVFLCAIICVVGLNSIIKCALRCSRSATATGSGTTTSARLANTGVKKKALKTFPTITYSPGLKLPGLDIECVICLSEFAPGERVRILPKCNHGFHIRCIDKWLTSHSSCPTCRHCLIETCQKIVGCSQVSFSEPLPSLQGSVIAPLEPEGLIRSYRDIP